MIISNIFGGIVAVMAIAEFVRKIYKDIKEKK